MLNLDCKTCNFLQKFNNYTIKVNIWKICDSSDFISKEKPRKITVISNYANIIVFLWKLDATKKI